ncbi:MAG TPA: TetR/AcrR family transcriptional regulator [Lunatimonas sp.]|nr:TetR/AcrR family transcriptional regulator [Lunatimonas sp.]
MEIDMHYPANDKLCLKNPEFSELGQRIVLKSIELINRLGIENFTFKKLAKEIQSNEASIYRYFENKHNLLVYLMSIYWDILNLKIRFSTQNLTESKDKIKNIIGVLTDVGLAIPRVKNIDLKTLHEIVISESAKAYLTKNIEQEIKEGFFNSYEKIILTLSDIFQEANPNYEFPKALAINLLETTYEQIFFAQHLGTFTELEGENLSSNTVNRFLESIIFSVLDLKDSLTNPDNQ